MVQKGPTIPIHVVNQGPIARLCPSLSPNFLWQPERICNGKGTESKRAEKEEKKEAKKKSERVVKEKFQKSKFCIGQNGATCANISELLRQAIQIGNAQ